MTETLAHGYSSEIVLSESNLMNTNMIRLQKALQPCPLDESCLLKHSGLDANSEPLPQASKKDLKWT